MEERLKSIVGSESARDGALRAAGNSTASGARAETNEGLLAAGSIRCSPNADALRPTDAARRTESRVFFMRTDMIEYILM